MKGDRWAMCTACSWKEVLTGDTPLPAACPMCDGVVRGGTEL